MNARILTADDIEHLAAGALFVSCAIDHANVAQFRDRALHLCQRSGRGPALLPVDALEPSARVAATGFVTSGFLPTEMVPMGDEFKVAVTLLEERLGEPVQGVYPLASANLNALMPCIVALLTGLPVIDADPMGRVFPLVSQTTLALAGLGAGPMAVVGVTGESAVLDVAAPRRADQVSRAVATEFGGWAATASYPVTAAQLAQHAVVGSISRLIELGDILTSPRDPQVKLHELGRILSLRRPIRARVVDVEDLSRPSVPGLPDRPSSVTFIDEAQDRIVRLEIQNEILLMLVDGAVQAIVPDVITLLRPDDASVAGLADLWVGNELDIISFPAAPQWYSPEGRALVEPMVAQFRAAMSGRP
jgi:DUF917 family protein